MSKASKNVVPKRGAHTTNETNVGKPAKKRDASFDIAKGLAIYLVVLGHMFAIGEIDAMSPVYNFINYTHMPVFFFISGWFFARYFRSHDGGEGKRFRQKAARLLVPFLLWSLVAWVFNVALHLKAGDPVLASVLWETLDIFFHARSLWFLLVMFFMFTFMLLCHWLGRKTPINQYIWAVAGWLVLYVFFPDNSSVSVFRMFKFEWLFPLFMGGCLLGGGTVVFEKIRDFYRRLKPLCIVVLLAAVACIVAFYSDAIFDAYSIPNVWNWDAPWYLAAIIVSYLVSFACVTLVLLFSGVLSRTPVAKILQTAGLYSLDVYVIHMFFISAIKIVLPEAMKVGAMFELCVSPLGSLVITVIVVLVAKYVLDRIPAYRRLMGRAGA